MGSFSCFTLTLISASSFNDITPEVKMVSPDLMPCVTITSLSVLAMFSILTSLALPLLAMKTTFPS